MSKVLDQQGAGAMACFRYCDKLLFTMTRIWGDPNRDKFGTCRDNGKENGNYRDYRGYVGIVENRMKTTGIIRIL